MVQYAQLSFGKKNNGIKPISAVTNQMLHRIIACHFKIVSKNFKFHIMPQ